MAEPGRALQPMFFVIREDESMVPLIALDELPAHIIVKDVPRALRPSQMGGMTCIGNFNARNGKHVIENTEQTISVASEETEETEVTSSKGHTYEEVGDDEFQGNSSCLADDDKSNIYMTQPYHEPATPLGYVEDTSVGTTHDHEVTSSCYADAGSGLLSTRVLTKTGQVKKYCSYWLRHGECDFSQQGCLYKHEMPQDLLTLNRLGLRDIPLWYRLRCRVGSFLGVRGSAGRDGVTNVEADGFFPLDPANRPPFRGVESWRQDVEVRQPPTGPRNPSTAPSYRSSGQENIATASVADPTLFAPRGPRGDPYGQLMQPPPSVQPTTPAPPTGPKANSPRNQIPSTTTGRFGTIQALVPVTPAAKQGGPPGKPSTSLHWPTNPPNNGPQRSTAHQKVKARIQGRGSRSSSFASDIEATYIKEDAERRAREDADYARQVKADDAKRRQEQQHAAATAAIAAAATLLEESIGDCGQDLEASLL